MHHLTQSIWPRTFWWLITCPLSSTLSNTSSKIVTWHIPLIFSILLYIHISIASIVFLCLFQSDITFHMHSYKHSEQLLFQIFTQRIFLKFFLFIKRRSQFCTCLNVAPVYVCNYPNTWNSFTCSSRWPLTFICISVVLDLQIVITSISLCWSSCHIPLQ